MKKYIAIKAENKGLSQQIARDIVKEVCEDITNPNPVFENETFVVYLLNENANVAEFMSEIFNKVNAQFLFDEKKYDDKKEKITIDGFAVIDIYLLPKEEIEELKLGEAPKYELIENYVGLELRKYDDHYECYFHGKPMTTTKGEIVQTKSCEVGRQLLHDYLLYKSTTIKAKNILNYQFIYQDLVKKKSFAEIKNMIDQSDWQEEWGLKPCPSGHPEIMMQWMELMGDKESRIKAINALFQKSTPMQISSLIVIFNEFQSFNLALIFASFAQFGEEGIQEEIDKLYNLLNLFGVIKCDMYDFEQTFYRFRVFYIEGANIK